MTKLFFPALAALSLAACGSNAPPPPADNGMAGHAMPSMAMPAPTGDQDRDFARQMIVHHQGAIEMARVQLARGKDAEMRRLAREIIVMQEREIAQFNAYLDRTGGR